jgi:hypothetical protein
MFVVDMRMNLMKYFLKGVRLVKLRMRLETGVWEPLPTGRSRTGNITSPGRPHCTDTVLRSWESDLKLFAS